MIIQLGLKGRGKHSEILKFRKVTLKDSLVPGWKKRRLGLITLHGAVYLFFDLGRGVGQPEKSMSGLGRTVCPD